MWQAILIPVIIIIVIVGIFQGPAIMKNMNWKLPDLGFSFSGPQSSPSPTTSPKQSPVSQIRPAPSTSTPLPTPPFLLDTRITEGPQEGVALYDTTTVVFKFSGSASPKTTEEKIRYETKILGFDQDWKETSDTKREATLPGGVQDYVFLVRSKLQGFVDQTPASRAFRVSVSPYYGKIEIQSVRPTDNSKARQFEVVLQPNLKDTEVAIISGWRVSSKWVSSFVIPYGIERFYPLLAAQNNEAIAMRKSTKVIIRGDEGTLGREVNFKTNACFGYLKPIYPKVPETPSCSVEKPTIKDVSYLPPLCQEYILNKVNYGSCQPPDYLKAPSVTNDYQCKTYLQTLAEKFTYESCYRTKQQEPNFLGNTWYIYMNRIFGHPLHDVITLYDQTGQVVDTYIY